MKEVPVMDGGDGCTTMHLMQLAVHLKWLKR